MPVADPRESKLQGLPAVSRYIANQEEHHKKVTFQQEYIAFLKKNKIAYDERYIWE